MRSKRCFAFVLIPAPVTPDLIRGRYDGDDARPPALIPKLIDNLERIFSVHLKRSESSPVS